jgi:LysR family transcriptional regulator, regulator for bpeEF and oprC
MRLTLHAIKVFVRAVEANSFVGAARSLLIDPTAVSRAIKALEAELGVLLFARSTRALKLTNDGARFYRDCVEILEKLARAASQFRADGAQPHGRLRIGMAPGIPQRLLLRAMPSFQEQYPQIDVVLLRVDDTAQVGDKGVDVLLRGRSLRRRGGQHPEPQGLVVRKLVQPQYIICASPDYLDRANTPSTPTDLLQHACIAHVTLERDIHEEWQFAKSHVRQKVRFAPKLMIQGIDGLRDASVAGCGIIRMVAWNVEDEIRSGKLVRILSDWECAGTPTTIAVYRKTRPMLPQVSVVVRHLAEEFQRYNRQSETGP